MLDKEEDGNKQEQEHEDGAAPLLTVGSEPDANVVCRVLHREVGHGGGYGGEEERRGSHDGCHHCRVQ